MVDFRKLRSTKAQPPATDPIEIFRRLPKAPEITDLYTMVAHFVKTEKSAQLRATFLLFKFYSFCLRPADAS